MFINYHRLITNSLLCRGVYRLAFAKPNVPILQSQFHKKGLPGFETPKGRTSISWRATSQTISKLQQELQSLRQLLLHQNTNNQKLQQYIYLSQQLSKVVGGLPLKNDYICKIIGWYNLVDFYKQLTIRLLTSEKEELRLLITCLDWMHFRWNNEYGLMDQDLIQGQHIKSFYKRLHKSALNISQLQSLESILCCPLYYQKREFYHNYVAQNLQKGLKQENPSQADDLIWLLQAYTKSMNDEELPLSLLEKHLLHHKPQLTPLSIQRLQRIYTLRGQINKEIYAAIIRPYIFKHKMSTIGEVVESIAFAVCSECEDHALLRTLYELVDTLQGKSRIESGKHLYLLHLYTHYLMIKGYRIKLKKELEHSILQFCRQRAQSRISISPIALAKLEQNPQHGKYVSPCLAQTTPAVLQHESTKQSKFQQQFALKLESMNLGNHQLHNKPIFCCFQLDFCLQDKASSQLHDIEIEGIQYIFRSGRLTRERQIRDQVLQHYGITVHHIDFNFIRNKQYSDLQDFFSRAPRKSAK